jgi:hypothetical protein
MHIFSIYKIDVQCMKNSNEHYVSYKTHMDRKASLNTPKDSGSPNL